MIISICIPTYMRPIMLGRLLGSLAALDTGGAAVHVVVVDNDPSGSAEPTVRRFESLIPNLVYQVEPRRGWPPPATGWSRSPRAWARIT